jgi:hypothetical protein
MHGQFFLEWYHIACHIFSFFTAVGLEGRPSFVSHRRCVLRAHPKLKGTVRFFEKIVEKEVEVSKLTFWNFFL